MPANTEVKIVFENTATSPSMQRNVLVLNESPGDGIFKEVGRACRPEPQRTTFPRSPGGPAAADRLDDSSDTILNGVLHEFVARFRVYVPETDEPPLRRGPVESGSAVAPNETTRVRRSPANP